MTAGSPASAASPVNVQIITIHAGIDVSQPTQSPRYWLKARQGHYLLYVLETHKLIHDGQLISLDGIKDNSLCSLALSHNGAHYAYANISQSNPNVSELYVDGKKVDSTADLSCPAVTNDGQHYFYMACEDARGITGICLYKDMMNLFDRSDGLLDYWISDDGSAYLASLRNIDNNGAFVESLVLNGNQIYKGGELKDTIFSDNGQHYAYISPDSTTNLQTLIIDGNVKRSSTAMALDQLTNSGSFCGWDAAKNIVFVNDREIPVASDSHVSCYINEDARHIFLHDGGWLLDRQLVQVENVVGADFVGETLYIYSVVQ